MSLTMAFFLLAALGLCLIGSLVCVVAAFRESLAWGFACLLVPFAALAFVATRWNEAKAGFVTAMVGLSTLTAVIFTQPPARAAFAQAVNHPEWAPVSHPKNPVKDLAAGIEEKRNSLVDLQEALAKATTQVNLDYQKVTKERQTLNTADQAAVHQFNLNVAAYQKQLAHVKQVTQQVDSTNAEIDDLLSKREALKAKAQVIIFSTSWCPACKTAKAYMDSKGISYRDVNVETSDGQAEYQAQGGDGAVPLIVVGNHKMRGFNAEELEASL